MIKEKTRQPIDHIITLVAKRTESKKPYQFILP